MQTHVCSWAAARRPQAPHLLPELPQDVLLPHVCQPLVILDGISQGQPAVLALPGPRSVGAESRKPQ